MKDKTLWIGLVLVGLLVFGGWLRGQQTVVTCPPGQTPVSTIAGLSSTTVCSGTVTPPPVVVAPAITALTASPSAITLGQSTTLFWTVTGVPTPALAINQGVGIVTGSSRLVTPAQTTLYTLTASNGVGVPAVAMVTVTVNAVVPPPVSRIWGVVDPTIIGGVGVPNPCTEAIHDRWVIDGGDGFSYRTWHPQQDPSGCRYAHEHGDSPDLVTDLWTRQNWDGRFGYAGRRMPSAAEPNGHEEPHEGFKIRALNIGEVNDEKRVNRTATISTFHMGTGGPRRFTQPMHSNSIAYRHQDGTHYAATHLMFDTGGNSDVCDPRSPGPTKDGLLLQNRCRVNSAYEIWSAQGTITQNGKEIYRGFATPAVFDPITVFDRNNTTAVIYAWDPRVAAIKNFPNDWSGFRGCDGEGYAQVGVFQNQGGSTVRWTDAMGRVVAQSVNAIRQVIAATSAPPPFSSDIVQFKLRRGHCGPGLGLKN